MFGYLRQQTMSFSHLSRTVRTITRKLSRRLLLFSLRVAFPSLPHRLEGERFHCENAAQSATSAEVLSSQAPTGRASAPSSVSQGINVADCNRGEGQTLSESGLNILTQSLDGVPMTAQPAPRRWENRGQTHEAVKAESVFC